MRQRTLTQTVVLAFLLTLAAGCLDHVTVADEIPLGGSDLEEPHLEDTGLRDTGLKETQLSESRPIDTGFTIVNPNQGSKEDNFAPILWESTPSFQKVFYSMDMYPDGSTVILTVGSTEEDDSGNINSDTEVHWISSTGAITKIVLLTGSPRGRIIAVSSGEVISTTKNQDQLVISKMNQKGETLWSIPLPNIYFSYDLEEDGSLVVVGSLTAGITLGAGEQNETTFTPNDKAFVAVYSAQGKLISAAPLNIPSSWDDASGLDTNVPKEIAVASNGTIYGAWYTKFFGQYITTVAFSKEGIVHWGNTAHQDARTMESLVVNDLSNSLFLGRDDAIVLAGYFTDDRIFRDVNGNLKSVSAPTQWSNNGLGSEHRSSFYVAGYNSKGELDFALSEYDEEWDNYPASSGSSGPQPTTALMKGNYILVSGGLVGTVVFGNGEDNETTLEDAVSSSYIAAYKLDGTLVFATYLECPIVGLAANEAGNVVAVTEEGIVMSLGFK